MVRKVSFRNTARDDLNDIFHWLEGEAGADVASSYIRRIRDRCAALSDYPNRGRPRADLAPGLRTTVFERRALIAYFVDEHKVQIVRILHHGRDAGAAFRD